MRKTRQHLIWRFGRAGLLLNSDGGTKVKTSWNLEKNTLFNCHFMLLNWPIFWIFLISTAPQSPGLYCQTNISLGSSGTHLQRSPQYLSFCFINKLSCLFQTCKGSARNGFFCPILATYRNYVCVTRPHYVIIYRTIQPCREFDVKYSDIPKI
jgi:hypothetical protein